jgi:hypothetical protein
MKGKSKGIALILILVVLTLIGLGVAGYFVIKPTSISPSPTPTPTTTLDGKDPRILSCEDSGGKWLEEYNECEGISESECDDLGGNFYPCESACRHDPSADVCIQVCVQVCKFNGRFCGGIAANLPENQCPEGYVCKLDGNYPDAGGVCVKK